MIGIPCFLLREKTAQSYQHAQGNDGAERGRREKRLIACTMIDYAMPRQGKRWHPSAGACGGWGTTAMRSPEFHAKHLFAARFSIPLSHHQMLALSLSAVSLWPRQKGRRAGIMPCGIPGVERLSAHA